MTHFLPIARHSASRRGLALALLSISATVSCSDSETLSSTVPGLTTVDLTLESSFVEVGQTISASAAALDQFAAPISVAA
jgi:hypothetical protein